MTTVTFVGRIGPRHIMRNPTTSECGRTGELRVAGEILVWSLPLCDACVNAMAVRRERAA